MECLSDFKKAMLVKRNLEVITNLKRTQENMKLLRTLSQKINQQSNKLIFNKDNDIDREDDSDNDPSWTSTKEDEQVLKEDEDQVDFLCDK